MKTIKWCELQDVLEDTKLVPFSETDSYIARAKRARVINRIIKEKIQPDDTIEVDDTFPSGETYESLTQILREIDLWEIAI